jgi:hypothetical protein
VLRLQLACNRVFLFDSVNGDGSSVKALAEAIYGQVIQLPMMFELIPALWANVRKIIQQSYKEQIGPLSGQLVLQREEAIKLLRPAVPGLPDESLWEALVFWGMLGDVVISSNVLVTDIETLIQLIRPILHHSPMESLNRVLNGDREKIECDEVVIPEFANLMADQQGDVRKWIEELEEDRILRFSVLEYMFCWKDLSREARRDTTKVLEACHLIVGGLCGNKSGYVTAVESTNDFLWLVTCRLDKAVSETSDPSVLTKEALGFQAQARYVPIGFFANLQASQLVHNIQNRMITTVTAQVDSSNMKFRFKTLFRKDWETVSVMLTRCINRGEGERMAVEVWSTSLAMLENVCRNMDRIRQDKFPGIFFQYVMWFRNDEFSDESLEWTLERSTGSLTAILEQRLMALPIVAKTWNSSVKIKGMIVQDAVRTLQTNAAFFLSHAWSDRSVREQARETVTEGLQRAVEEISGELMWVDAAEMKFGTQFHKQMEKGVRDAQCIVICLSYVYLTRPNCLQELCWAVQGHASEGKPLIVVSVDQQLTFEAIKGWNTSQNLEVRVFDHQDKEVNVIVDRRTLAFVRKWLLRVKVFTQWQDGEGGLTKERRSAVEEMLMSLRILQRDSDMGQAPSLQVDQEGGSWFVLET